MSRGRTAWPDRSRASLRRTAHMTATNDRGWNLYCRNDGQWVLQFRSAPGKWRETRIPREHRSERAAERYAMVWLNEYRKQLGEGPVVPKPNDDRPTVRSLVDRWLELTDRNPKLSPATRKQHRSCMRLHVLAYPEVADAPLAELRPAVLRAWLRKVRDHGKISVGWAKGEDGKRARTFVRGGALAPFTCRNVVNSLTAFFADAMAEEWVELPANPMKHEAVRREVPAGITLAGKHRIIHLTRPVAERVLASESVPEWRRVRLLFALTAGCSEGEISALRWDDVELDAEIPTAKVTKSLALEGDRGWVTLRKTKTDNRVRVLPLHKLAARALRAWRAAGWPRLVGRTPSPTDPVFPNEAGTFWRPTMAAMLRGDLRAAGLPDSYEGHPYTAHATRRSFATWLSEAGVAEATIKRLMGHAGSGVTQLHYTAQDALDAPHRGRVDRAEPVTGAARRAASSGRRRGRERHGGAFASRGSYRGPR
jgi:integrase